MGDFNAKIGGRAQLDDEIMGRHGKGVRNENGVIIANFLRETNLFAINTFFKHRPMNRATWHGGNPAKNPEILSELTLAACTTRSISSWPLGG